MKSVSSVFSREEHSFTIDLVDEFLAHRTYQHAFCLKLFGLGKNPSVSWDDRRLAALMAEHQILQLQPDQLNEFDVLFGELRLKRPGLHNPIARSVLKEGYSTTELRGFIVEFLRRLARMERVHRHIHRHRGIRGVRGSKTSDAVSEFVEHSRRDCKLTLARYLFTPGDVIREVLRHVTVTEGVRDIDVSQPRFVDAEIKHSMSVLPDYEAGILQRLCAGSKVYWVAEKTSSAINSLVEYPLSTVVLVIKPPGSEIEFELKRAGRKGGNSLGIVFRRNGRNVPASHRLDGGSMQWLLRYEARSGSKMSSIFRLVHRIDAPMPGYIARNTVYSIPTRNRGAAPSFRYFTEPDVFGNGHFREMRSAMKEAVRVYERDEGGNLPAVGGAMGLTAEFLSHVAPAQAILSGTSSFRIDKVATYLSSDGAEKYFRVFQGIAYSADDARRFADELLDEVLGVYEPPLHAFKNYGRYVDAALAVPANRERANRIFLSLVRQVADFWGAMLGIRGQSRGESFVGRNVGIRSVWVDGQWGVKLIFMDHDALTLPDPEIGHFFAQNALPGMLLDERHIWGKANPALFPTSLVGYLLSIYRIDSCLAAKAQQLAETELLRAYKKTQEAVLNDRKLRAFVSDVFVSRLLDWDQFVSGFLHPLRGWETRMKRVFKDKGYEPDAFEYYAEACEKYRGFIERNAFLYLHD